MNNLQSIEGTIHGELHIGAIESSRLPHLINVIESVIEDFPLVRLQLHTGTNSDIRSQLDSGLLDFGIVTSKAHVQQYSSIDFPEIDSWELNISQNNSLD
ncbi:putative LysR family transcriptional regulator [Secundilactobacillus oryzae JCM 18671]|uniref:Putative LysR family transcriptional regulator n=1 Tax=Secundilactobacillus oryzae JCM 18671 TaxID=1291743 RepID=A0A081BFT6_9LACO|nr:putative LysR family transcriptional regulator [Secundilactobacillus oryzae JCM 18671]